MRRVRVGPGMYIGVPDELETAIAEYLHNLVRERGAEMSKNDEGKKHENPAERTEEERQAIALARHRRRRNIVEVATEAAAGKSHVADRVELVRRYVAGVAHEFEVLMADHRDKYGEVERQLDGPSDALGKAAVDYASGGALGDFLLALDVYNNELRRIAKDLPVRSSSD